MASHSPNQADQRRSASCRDQHGRLWSGPVEMKTGHFCAQPTPDGWTAPLMPEGPYVKIRPNTAELAIEIDYTGWLTDLRAAHREWEQNLRRFAQAMYGDAMAQQVETPSAALLAEAGPKPFPLEPVIAASQGNKWILGLSPVDTKGVGKYLPKKADDLSAYDFADDTRELRDNYETGRAEPVRDAWAELEEELDPDAVGGKRIPVKPSRRGAKPVEA